MLFSRNKLLLFFLILVSAAGCFGNHAPREVYLRIGNDGGVCSGQDIADKPVIMIRDLQSLPVLNSQTVVLAKDNVLQQSASWLWEGKPSEIMSKMLENNLSCTTNFKIVSRYTSRIENSGLLYGDIRSFDVVMGDQPKFQLTVDFELWTSRGKSLLVSRRFHTEAPMSKVDPSEITDAADKAVSEMLEQVGQWINSLDLES